MTPPYPGQVCEVLHTNSFNYCSPLDDFVDEHLRLAALPDQSGQLPKKCKLFNRAIDDDHFSPAGAELWAQVVGKRLIRILSLQAAQRGKVFPDTINRAALSSSGHP